jgi:serine/threonine-protein kinase Chk2
VEHALTAHLQQSQGEQVEPKKVRHSRLSPGPTSRLKQGQLPSPITNKESTASDDYKEGTATPPNERQSQAVRSPKGLGGLSSPPSDTQPFSQFVYPPESRTYAVDDEQGEKVWGYLVPMDGDAGNVLVLRKRQACPVPTTMVGRTNGRENVRRDEYKAQEEEYEHEKQENGVTAGGYLIGRHRECGM